jgi:predicted MFS family arabinose efflux permease
MFGSTFGLIFGQAASGILAEYLNWRAVFFVLAVLFLIAAIGLRLEIGRPEKPPPVPPKSVRSTARDLFRIALRPEVRVVLITVFAEGALLLGTFAFLGSHLHDRFDLRFDQIGLLLALFGLGGITFLVLSAFLIRTLGERGLIGFGGLFVGAAMAGAAFAGSAAPFFIIAPVIGLGFTMFHNTLQTRATQMAPANRGSAVSLFASCFFLGQTTGVALAGWSYDLWGAVPGFAVSALCVPLLAAIYLSLGKKPVDRS